MPSHYCRCSTCTGRASPEAVRPCVVELGHRLRVHRSHRRPAGIHQRQYQNGEHRHLDFLGFDLLADIFRRAANHQAGDENRNDDEQQHAVHAGADAADDDLAELDIDQRNDAAQRGKQACMALTAPQEAAVVITANSAEATIPKRTSLPSMLPPARPSPFMMSLPCASAE